METALQIKRNAEEQQSAVKDLLKWEDEIKVKDKKAVGEKVYHVPIRNSVTNSTVKKDRISSLDYRKWDTFNVEKELENVDYETNKEEVKIEEKIVKNNEDALVEKEKGNLYFKKQKFQKAILCYTKSLELNFDVIPLVNRALCYLKIQDYLNAEKDCSKVLEVDVKNIKALHRRGLARKNLKKYSEAKKDFQHCLVLEPTNSTVKKDLQELDNIIGIFNGKTMRKRIPIEEINKPIARAAEKHKAEPIQSVKESISRIVGEKKESSKPDVPISQVEDDEKKIQKETKNIKVNQDNKKNLVAESTKPDVPKHAIDSTAKTNQVVGEDCNKSLGKQRKELISEIIFDVATLERPKTLFEFEQNWKNLDRESQYKYLKTLDNDLSLFKTSFDQPLLLNILEIVNSYCDNEESILLLTSLSKLPRFSMVYMFLKDKTIVQSIFAKLNGDHFDLKKIYKIKN
ncbi:hypothetical protein HDV06_003251 [Boothiomyces sp. JEL0866]|nr:hypothetical protein HDV06_003251 [Boothiomyces sp. JEL0866]